MLYAVVLTIHSWLRWGVLLAGLIAFFRSAVGASRRATWTPADDRAGFWLSMVLDAQFLLGLILYVFLSPFTHAAFRDIGGAMGNSGLRFWLVEHVFGYCGPQVTEASPTVHRGCAGRGRCRWRRLTSPVTTKHHPAGSTGHDDR